MGCTQSMLLCLDRPHRIAHILGDILELPGDEAATVLGVAPAAYRRRLQRACERIQCFMRGHCGLIDPANPCRCSRRIGTAIATGRVDPHRPLFAAPIAEHVEQIEGDAAAVFRSHPQQHAPDRVVAAMTAVHAAGRGGPDCESAAYRLAAVVFAVVVREADAVQR